MPLTGNNSVHISAMHHSSMQQKLEHSEQHVMRVWKTPPIYFLNTFLKNQRTLIILVHNIPPKTWQWNNANVPISSTTFCRTTLGSVKVIFKLYSTVISIKRLIFITCQHAMHVRRDNYPSLCLSVTLWCCIQTNADRSLSTIW